MQYLLTVDSRVRITVVTDVPYDEQVRALALGPDIEVLGTPPSFRPPHARYKARALEWFRVQKQLADSEWVLHLDEETIVDAHAVRTCIEFAEGQEDYELGQGPILYNAHEYWKKPFLTVADLTRSRDDYARFWFAYRHVHRPIFGVHGSFLLTSGRVENAVGWDTDSLVEDFWFGLGVRGTHLLFFFPLVFLLLLITEE